MKIEHVKYLLQRTYSIQRTFTVAIPTEKFLTRTVFTQNILAREIDDLRYRMYNVFIDNGRFSVVIDQYRSSSLGST